MKEVSKSSEKEKEKDVVATESETTNVQPDIDDANIDKHGVVDIGNKIKETAVDEQRSTPEQFECRFINK